MSPIASSVRRSAILTAMGGDIEQPDHRPVRDRPETPKWAEARALGQRLLDILVWANRCRLGDKPTRNDLAETSEIGDWKMPDFKVACAYAASQGWLVVQDDV